MSTGRNRQDHCHGWGSSYLAVKQVKLLYVLLASFLSHLKNVVNMYLPLSVFPVQSLFYALFVSGVLSPSISLCIVSVVDHSVSSGYICIFYPAWNWASFKICVVHILIVYKCWFSHQSLLVSYCQNAIFQKKKKICCCQRGNLDFVTLTKHKNNRY